MNFLHMNSDKMCSFVAGFFHSAFYFCSSPKLLGIYVSFILLYRYVVFYCVPLLQFIH